MAINKHIPITQNQRLLKSLEPDYVKVDERDQKALLEQPEALSKLIQFFNIENEKFGSWEEFFPKIKAMDRDMFEDYIKSLPNTVQIHLATYLAFLASYKHTQNHINTITKRHLDFYYKDVLRLKEKKAIPDKVHVGFELAKNIDSHKIEEGTLLNAGKDKLGVDLLYQVDDEIVINKATIESLKSVYVNQDNKDLIYASPIANSADGIGKDLPKDNLVWNTFGESQTGLSVNKRTMPDASIGFAIASPMLLLQEGNREIVLTLKFDQLVKQTSEDITAEELEKLIKDDTEGLTIQEMPSLSVEELGGYTINDLIGLNIAELKGLIARQTINGVTKELPIPTFKKLEVLIIDKLKTKELAERKVQVLKAYKESLEAITEIQFSGKKGWVGPFIYKDKPVDDPQFISPLQFVVIDEDENADEHQDLSKTITITITVPQEFPAILAYDSEKLDGGFSTEMPVVKVVMNPYKNIEAIEKKELVYYPVFEELNKISLLKLDLVVTVKEMYDIVLQNDRASIKPGKPFTPFGQTPVVGSSFYIGSPEALLKNPDSVDVTIEWMELPEDLVAYYEIYKDDYVVTNCSFQADADVLIDKEWVPIPSAPQIQCTETLASLAEANEALKVAKANYKTAADNLESAEAGGDKDVIESAQKAFNAADVALKAAKAAVKVEEDAVTPVVETDETPVYPVHLFKDDEGVQKSKVEKTFNFGDKFEGEPLSMDTFKRLEPSSQKGFIRLQIKDQDFGHKAYTKVLTRQSIALSNYKEPDPQTDPPTVPPSIPDTPYTPTIKSIKIGYTAHQEIDMVDENDIKKNKENFDEREANLFHISAFGNNELHPYTNGNNSEDGIITLLPVYDNQGSLYIGIKDLVPPQNLSILFQVSAGSADPKEAISKDDFIWSYLGEYKWHNFDPLQILSDTSEGFITSGIATIQIPEELTSKNPLMTEGLHWIKASAKKNSNGVAKMIELKAQMVKASFVDKDNDPDHLKTPLAAELIAKLDEKDAAIKSVFQPYASFDGRIEEQSNEFYTRVSERLRHKNRSVSAWDYERMVLEKFPSIYMTKCLNHTNLTSLSKSGAVTVIVVPSLLNIKGSNRLSPKTDFIMLQRIQKYLKQYISPFVTLEVINPEYQEVKMDFNVRFLPGFDAGFYGQKLNEDIISFLSPWSTDEGSDMVFGGLIYKSAVLQFVEDREYVDYVTDFKFYFALGLGAMKIGKSFRIYSVIEKAETNDPRTILISSKKHNIRVLEPASETETKDEIIGAAALGGGFKVAPSKQDTI